MVGHFRRGNEGLPWKLEVEFSSQPNYAYEYTTRGFGDEGDAPLELAYAITVHRAQGSEFGKTILILPKDCRPLSRELLYTALTRQQEKVVILYQGDLTLLKRYADVNNSGLPICDNGEQLSALDSLATHSPGVESEVVDRSTMLRALASLTSLEREAVLLVARGFDSP